jgi:hypothetical protein
MEILKTVIAKILRNSLNMLLSAIVTRNLVSVSLLNSQTIQTAMEITINSALMNNRSVSSQMSLNMHRPQLDLSEIVT